MEKKKLVEVQEEDDGFLTKIGGSQEIEDIFEHSEKNEFTDIKSFDELDIDKDLLRGIYTCGYDTPSPIQKKGIVPILSGRDVIAQSQSGTGKTLTFCIGGLSRINVEEDTTQLLILSPTRELTMQISEVARNISERNKKMKIKTLVGGNSVQEDLNDLKTTTYHAIVGCPGRVTDIIKRKAFESNTIKTFIMDEADEMLKKGFQEQIIFIFGKLSPEVQVVLFSATIPTETMEITKKFMRNPVSIRVKTENLSLEGIDQHYIMCDSDNHKVEMLLRLFETMDLKQCIIYANSVDRVKHLNFLLTKEKYSVGTIHSDLEKRERELLLTKFKSGEFRLLVSTDLTARGIDVQQVSVVINFDLPRCENVYLHRIGRSGRWGRKGVAINLVSEKDTFTMKRISSHYKKPILQYNLV
jgi:translation initiation factor 4A